MNKGGNEVIKVLLLLVISLINFYGLGQENENFLSREDLKSIYEQMIAEIEYLDAEAIEVRNRLKNIKWEQYVTYHKTNFLASRNYEDLKKAFIAFGEGFTNGHSKFRFLYPIKKLESKSKSINRQIGFTYPGLSFFDIKTKKKIEAIDGYDMDSLFHQFQNYQTNALTQLASQNHFVSCINQGKYTIKDDRPKQFRLSDHKVVNVIYNDAESKTKRALYDEEVNTVYQDWNLIAKGYKTAVFIKDSIALVKIKNFGFKRSSSDLNCEGQFRDSTLCNDIQIMRNALRTAKERASYLIIDLQDNRGGNENTAFLKELCPYPFKDMSVQYRKTKMLQEDHFRLNVFYGFKGAEVWFDEIQNNGIFSTTKEGAFLPPRADFCRGAVNCDLKDIPLSDYNNYDFKTIIILVNEITASSADDFTFRMKKYGKALIAGQPQSADLTFALVDVTFFLDKNNNLVKKYFSSEADESDLKAIFSFSIPYSKTINDKGKLLQGNPLELDLLIPITHDNYADRYQHTLDTAVDKLIYNKKE